MVSEILDGESDTQTNARILIAIYQTLNVGTDDAAQDV